VFFVKITVFEVFGVFVKNSKNWKNLNFYQILEKFRKPHFWGFLSFFAKSEKLSENGILTDFTFRVKKCQNEQKHEKPRFLGFSRLEKIQKSGELRVCAHIFWVITILGQMQRSKHRDFVRGVEKLRKKSPLPPNFHDHSSTSTWRFISAHSPKIDLKLDFGRS